MLTTTDLTIGYGTHIVQQGLNLETHSRDLICLVGTNGAGKSTLLRTISGLQKPLSGTISIEGKELRKLNNHERSLLYAMVLTDAIYVENLTVFELVALGRIPHTDWTGALTLHDKQLITEAIEHVNLTHKTHAYLNAISDGEKQRAVIAKALAQDTPLVLLDEPTAHLDLPNRIEIMLLLRRLSVNTGKTFILSTHELDLALQMADKIWLMTQGHIEIGIPEDLMLSGKFQNAFGNSSYHFDEEDGHCKIHHLIGPLEVSVTGVTPALSWLKRALIRCGIQVSDCSAIEIIAHENGFSIGEAQFKTISETLNYLSKHYATL